MYAIYRTDTGQWLNTRGSLRGHSWMNAPRLYEDFGKAKRSLASYKGSGEWPPRLAKYIDKIVIVEVSLFMNKIMLS